MPEAFNAEMLKLARDVRGINQSELAAKAGVTQAFISKLEHGLNGQFEEAVLAGIAGVLHFPVHFFYRQDRPIGLPQLHFRKKAKLSGKALAKLTAAVNIKCWNIASLLRSYEIVPEKPIPQIDPEETGQTPEKIAEKLRAYWLLPRGPIHNLTEVMEGAGGIITIADFGTNLLDGLSLRPQGMPPLFFMNKNMPGDRFRFSLAHELGHMVMHDGLEEGRKKEDEANRFAAAFLMPAAEIKPYLFNVSQINGLGRVKDYWKVSIKALIYRMNYLGLITPSKYKAMSIQYNQFFREGEPNVVAMEKAYLLQKMVQFHCRKLQYSMQDLVKVLRLNEDDIRQIYFEEEKPSLRLVVSN